MSTPASPAPVVASPSNETSAATTLVEQELPARDNRDVAIENELTVLKQVRWYGHLRRIEVARAVWSRSTPGVAMKMAHRTVARMIRKGELIERANLVGGRSLVLARRGAARLLDCEIDAHDGYDLSSVCGPHFLHRTLGTRYLIERQATGEKVFSEHALLRGWGPMERGEFVSAFGKIPDGLVLSGGTQRGMDAHVSAADWIEVESSYKPRKKLAQIFRVALETIPSMRTSDDLVLDRVFFVYDVRQRHEKRILEALKTYVAERGTLDRSVLSNIILVRCYVDTPLVWRGYEEIDCAKLLSEAL